MFFKTLLQIPTTLTDTAAAAADATAAMPTEETLSVFDLALKGGVIMIPIGILSIVAIYIFIERFLTLRKANQEDKFFMKNIKDYVSNGNIDAARRLCQQTETPIARMLEKGNMRIGRPLKDIETAVENIGKLEVYKLERNLSSMATIAGAAPMLGFLGTVTGMIGAFFEMSKAGNNIEPGILAGGIYEAMVTTVAGLVVGIMAYVAYNYLASEIQKVIYKLEARAVDFLDLLQE